NRRVAGWWWWRHDDLEVDRPDTLKGVNVLPLPSPVGSAGQVKRAAIVGQDHPVALECLGDDPRTWRKVRQVVVGPESQSRSHWQQFLIADPAGEVACRIHELLPGRWERESQRVTNLPDIVHFVGPNQPGKDRQSCGICRGPTA